MTYSILIGVLQYLKTFNLIFVVPSLDINSLFVIVHDQLLRRLCTLTVGKVLTDQSISRWIDR